MLQIYTQQQINALTANRKGELKLGEKVRVLKSLEDLQKLKAPFVLLGIKEDIGIRANMGIGGASTAWDYALKSILNVQNNQFLEGEDVLIAGALEFKAYMAEANTLNPHKSKDLERLRILTSAIDAELVPIITKIVHAGKIPIIIGGGHNNAYGNITGSSNTLKKAINVLNIDPHSDFRALEGRHSGNGFSYAKAEKKLGKYAVWGWHESYNSEALIEAFENDADLFYQTFESLLWRNTQEKDILFKNTLQSLGNEPMGLELDLDAITRFPVSALNPSGFSLNEARHYVMSATAIKKPIYFHICEGSPERASSPQEKDMLGKSIAYLITDFIKSYKV